MSSTEVQVKNVAGSKGCVRIVDGTDGNRAYTVADVNGDKLISALREYNRGGFSIDSGSELVDVANRAGVPLTPVSAGHQCAKNATYR